MEGSEGVVDSLRSRWVKSERDPRVEGGGIEVGAGAEK